MSLTPEQSAAVTSWVAAGDNLSAIQKKLSEQFKISLTYRDVRFLVDDLNLALKDAAPKIDASDVTKAAPAPAAREAGAAPGSAPGDDDEDVADNGGAPAGGSGVTVTLDKVTLIPGALASGSVTFSDGVTGQWIVDNQGRPGFTKISQPGYRPSPADGQAFMQELGAALQKRGY